MRGLDRHLKDAFEEVADLRREVERLRAVTLTRLSNLGPHTSAGDVVYADNADSAAVDVSEVTDVTIKTRDVTGVVAGDSIQAELIGTILNDSGATRNWTFTPDFDNDFDPEHAVNISTIAASRSVFVARWNLVVVSTSVAHMHASLLIMLQHATGTYRNAMSGSDWEFVYDDSVNDLTGTVTVSLKIRSNNATATQELLVHSFVIRKISST